MSLVVVGLSHRSASMALLERCALTSDQLTELVGRVGAAPHVVEALVLATCNRLEIYAEVTKFHGGVTDVGRELGRATGVPLPELRDHLYIRYEDAVAAHLFEVTCGLHSMAVGEPQILGQVRASLRTAQQLGTCGRVLGTLLRQALRAGKRARSETDLDHASPSLVTAGLDQAREVLGPLGRLRALVVGSGAMSSLAVATLQRAGVASVQIVSRSPERAGTLAATTGIPVLPLTDLATALVRADLVVSATGATGQVIRAEVAAAAGQARNGVAQVYLDLALPRDVDPEVARVPGVRVIDLDALGRALTVDGDTAAEDLAAVRAIVVEEVAGYLDAVRAEAVAPTVTALRGRANSVVELELARLESRLGQQVDERVRAEIARTVHRVVDKLLHAPTVRVKELAAGPEGDSYARVLRELFDLEVPCQDTAVLDPDRVDLRAVGGAGADLPAITVEETSAAVGVSR